MSNHKTLLKVSYTRPNTALALTPFRRVFQEFLKEPNVSLLLLSCCGFSLLIALLLRAYCLLHMFCFVMTAWMTEDLPGQDKR